MEECGLCIGGGEDFEPWDFCQTTYPKARKPHKCCECYREIAKGSEYQNLVGKYDGEIYTHKTCMDCVAIRNGMSCDEGVGLGNLWDEIWQIFPDFNTTCLQKIKTVSAKEYILERWREWKFKKVNQDFRTRDSVG